jgi:hypothetical protein
MKVPVLPHSLQHLLLLLPLNMTILTGGEMKCKCSFDLHFFIAKEVEHLLMFLLAIFTSSFENSLFKSYVHFLLGCSFFGGSVF